MSYKLIDQVNIAIEDKHYFKSEKWLEENKEKLLAPSESEWLEQLTEAHAALRETESSVNLCN